MDDYGKYEVLDEGYDFDGEEEEVGWAFPSASAALATTKQTAVSAKTTAKEWLQKPTWAGGPPRWQVGLAGTAGAVGLGALLWAVVGRK
jgi:hypothetical protein